MKIAVSEDGLIANLITEFDSIETYDEYLTNPIIVNYHALRANFLTIAWPPSGWYMTMVDSPLIFSTP